MSNQLLNSKYAKNWNKFLNEQAVPMGNNSMGAGGVEGFPGRKLEEGSDENPWDRAKKLPHLKGEFDRMEGFPLDHNEIDAMEQEYAEKNDQYHKSQSPNSDEMIDPLYDDEYNDDDFDDFLDPDDDFSDDMEDDLNFDDDDDEEEGDFGWSDEDEDEIDSMDMFDPDEEDEDIW